jgi:hypothetical protein
MPARASQFGWRQPLAAAPDARVVVADGFLAWAFYASQPYLLDLARQRRVWIAGFVAAGSRSRRSRETSSSSVALAALRTADDAPPRPRRSETCAAVGLGLAGSFWVALPALLLDDRSIGVTSPVASAYLHQVVPASSARPSSRSTR